MAQDWDIRPRSTQCSECDTVFENKESYYSALVHGADGFQRGDFCTACWVGKEAELQPYSSWKGTFLAPPDKADDEPLKKATAESLLRKLIEDDDEDNAPVIYILVIMLERKKVLVEKDVKIDEDGTMHRVYEHRQSGETFLILDPQLKLDKLESVQIRVADMLGGGEKAQNKTESEEPKPEVDDDESEPSEDATPAEDGEETEVDDDDEYEDDEDDDQ